MGYYFGSAIDVKQEMREYNRKRLMEYYEGHLYENAFQLHEHIARDLYDDKDINGAIYEIRVAIANRLSVLNLREPSVLNGVDDRILSDLYYALGSFCNNEAIRNYIYAVSTICKNYGYASFPIRKDEAIKLISELSSSYPYTRESVESNAKTYILTACVKALVSKKNLSYKADKIKSQILDDIKVLPNIEFTSLVPRNFYIGHDEGGNIVVFKYVRETKKGYSCEAMIYSECRISFDKNIKISLDYNLNVVVEISKESYKAIKSVLKDLEKNLEDIPYHEYSYDYKRCHVDIVNTIDDVDYNIYMSENGVELDRGF